MVHTLIMAFSQGQFTDHFKDITDDEVSGRYHYGEIRLSRLNYYALAYSLGQSRKMQMQISQGLGFERSMLDIDGPHVDKDDIITERSDCPD
jgi:hypothetical protein